MNSYYEVLKISPEASADDIQTAIDSRYNQYRELVTHPDPEVRSEAERSLRLLEVMRTTLTDPAKRAVYDAGIGLNSSGGLADPEALLKRPPPPKPKPAPGIGEAEATPTDLWTCPKCQTRNPEWTQYCLNCQYELVRKCPECGQMRSLVKTGVCGHCGIAYERATQRVELKSFITTNSVEIDKHQAILTNLEGRFTSAPPSRPLQLGCMAFFSIILILSVAILLSEGEIIGAFVFVAFSIIFLLLVVRLRRYNKREIGRMKLNLPEQIKEQRDKLRLLQEQQQEALDTYQKLGVRKAA